MSGRVLEVQSGVPACSACLFVESFLYHVHSLLSSESGFSVGV
jgi:hypothetical protein